MAGFQIVTLSPVDWQPYRDLRLEALQREPLAYTSRFNEMRQRPDSFWQSRLTEAQAEQHDWLLFAQQPVNTRLVGMIGAHSEPGSTTVHIISFYVSSPYRGQGVGSSLLHAILERVEQAGRFTNALLTVNTQQTAALALYRRFGFQITGEQTEVMGEGLPRATYTMQKPLPGQVA